MLLYQTMLLLTCISNAKSDTVDFRDTRIYKHFFPNVYLPTKRYFQTASKDRNSNLHFFALIDVKTKL